MYWWHYFHYCDITLNLHYRNITEILQRENVQPKDRVWFFFLDLFCLCSIISKLLKKIQCQWKSRSDYFEENNAKKVFNLFLLCYTTPNQLQLHKQFFSLLFNTCRRCRKCSWLRKLWEKKTTTIYTTSWRKVAELNFKPTKYVLWVCVCDWEDWRYRAHMQTRNHWAHLLTISENMVVSYRSQQSKSNE